MLIKKDFQELVTFLETNKNKKVDTILEMVREMCSSKNETNFKKDELGNVTHVFCYYHKQWEDVSVVEYGTKVSNKSTGLNTMCKIGLNQWSKQQRDYKKSKEQLLDKMSKGELSVDELNEELTKLDAERQVIVPRPE